MVYRPKSEIVNLKAKINEKWTIQHTAWDRNYIYSICIWTIKDEICFCILLSFYPFLFLFSLSVSPSFFYSLLLYFYWDRAVISVSASKQTNTHTERPSMRVCTFPSGENKKYTHVCATNVYMQFRAVGFSCILVVNRVSKGHFYFSCKNSFVSIVRSNCSTLTQNIQLLDNNSICWNAIKTSIKSSISKR